MWSIQDLDLFLKGKSSGTEAATSALASCIAAHTAPIAWIVAKNCLAPDGVTFGIAASWRTALKFCSRG